jgi:hypothetical protein
MGSPHISMGIALFLLFSVTLVRPFLTKQKNTAKTSAIPSFNARDASGRTPLESARAYASSGRGAPFSSRRALTPRCPTTRRKRRGHGFGRGVGGAGADWATCLSLLERAAAAAADVARDSAASTAASSTRVGGGVSLRV